jgi:hypothetical protein
MYYRLGKFEDIRRSATRAMRWAKDFRMDAPWSQRGENTHNPWSDSGKFRVGGVAVMVDNFAIPAATIRGLFDCEYRSDRLILRPRVPGSITQYTQNQPIRFGEKQLFLSCNNGGTNVKEVKVNGKTIGNNSVDEVVLLYSELPATAKIEISTEGEWPDEASVAVYPVKPSLMAKKAPNDESKAELPESLKKPLAVLTAMSKYLSGESEATYERAFLTAAINSFEEYRVRLTIDPGPGYYRPITPERKEGIDQFYEKTALSMYNGFVNRMAIYAAKGDPGQKRIAAIFANAQK